MEDERELAGGNSSVRVVRVGNTVRKPWADSTAHVLSYVEALRNRGVDVPAPLGRDEAGRQVQEFVRGDLATQLPALSLSALSRIGAIVRSIHDASEHFAPPADAGWETAIAPPGQDLAYSALAFTLSDARIRPLDASLRLAAFVDGYSPGASMREGLPEAMSQRSLAMYELLRSSHDAGQEPWSTMYVSGHGDHWREVTQYVAANQSLWHAALG